jgi:ferric-dicitrate binding protein FerR (iron transport regulator)
MTHEPDSPGNEAKLAALVRGALPREPSPAARERARITVEAEWRAAVAARQGRPDARSSPPRARRFAVAAGLAAAGAAAVFGWLASQEPAERPMVATLERGSLAVHGAPLAAGAGIAAGDVVTVRDGAGALLRLGPGLSLRVAAGTEATVASTERVELRAGRVFVDALPGADDALTVATSRGDVRHLGTQYEVVDDSGRVEVAVREGRVQVASAGAAAMEAAAGELLVLRAGAPAERQAIADAAARFGWIAALPSPVVIDGRPLAEFLSWYARETGRSVSFASADLERQAATITLSGSVDGLSPEAALEVVAASTDLGVRRAPGALELGPARAP